MQSDTDDAETDIEDPKLSKPSSVIEMNTSIKCESVSAKIPNTKTLTNLVNRPRHSVVSKISVFSDQTECKRQQPLKQSTTPGVDTNDDTIVIDRSIDKSIDKSMDKSIDKKKRNC